MTTPFLVEQAIKEWSEAFSATEANPRQMLSGEISVGEAANRMSLYQAKEDALWFWKNSSELPFELVRWFNTQNRSACDQCWISSSGSKHPECQAKIDEYFSARKALAEYGTALV
jgi:hypothetical protein